MIDCLQKVNENPRIMIQMNEDLLETSVRLRSCNKKNRVNKADNILTPTKRKCTFINGNTLCVSARKFV